MRITKTKIAALAIVAAGALTATGAYAYWTTSGEGSGSAASAAENGTVTLHASFATGIFPGGSKTVSFTADNPGATDLYVGTIHLASVDATEAAGVTGECNVADFTMADVTSNTTVVHGASGQSLTGSGTLNFANSSSNQDACKGATITLNLTSN